MLLRPFPILSLLYFILMVIITTHGIAQAPTVRFVNADGELILEVASVLHGNTVYLPVETVKSVFDSEMRHNYNLPKKQLTLKTKGKELRLLMGTPSITIISENQNIPIKSPPRILIGQPMLPISFFQEILPLLDDVVVLYNPVLHRVRITPKTVFATYSENNNRSIVVIIDPGHGGETDVGCISQNGLAEKDVVLAVAKEVQNVSKQHGITIHLTREKDVNKARNQRVQFTNKNQADLFLSLHCNASFSTEQNGMRIYLNNPNGDLRSKTDVTQVFGSLGLSPLTQTSFITQSRDFASILQKELNFYSEEGVHIREFPLIALSDVYMPAVLLELGYLSNIGDATLLSNPKSITELALSIVRALKVYATSMQKIVENNDE